MKIFLHSIGCRLNQSEIEAAGRQLSAAGHRVISTPEGADKVIINTCAVTREAAKDARTMTRRIHRQNSRAEILLTGCYATVAPETLSQVNGAGRIVPNRDKHLLVQIIDPSAPADMPNYEMEPLMREQLNLRTANTRAFVKVQDGCDNRCTFCVTTIARGPGRSRPLGDIVAEIQAMASAGYQEVVLTGVHLGSYGRDMDTKTGLASLVAAILRHTDIPRLRLSSLEPWDIAADFFELWKNPRLLPHLHVPLQSGSDRILRRMARRTNRASFRRLVTRARESIPSLNLSTDLIAGFPGEKTSDFEDTLSFVAEIGFSRLHVFPYSSRPGTAAAAMEGHLPKRVRKERARRLIELGKELSLDFHRKFEGQQSQVLWESFSGAGENGLRWMGYTDNYIRVTVESPLELFNRVTLTHLSKARPDGMSGQIKGH